MAWLWTVLPFKTNCYSCKKRNYVSICGPLSDSVDVDAFASLVRCSSRNLRGRSGRPCGLRLGFWIFLRVRSHSGGRSKRRKVRLLRGRNSVCTARLRPYTRHHRCMSGPALGRGHYWGWVLPAVATDGSTHCSTLTSDPTFVAVSG